MAKNRWSRFKRSFLRNFLDFLNIFAAEDRFIHEHKHKSSEIKEQERYDSLSKKKGGEKKP